jgi:hypothetical protein
MAGLQEAASLLPENSVFCLRSGGSDPDSLRPLASRAAALRPQCSGLQSPGLQCLWLEYCTLAVAYVHWLMCKNLAVRNLLIAERRNVISARNVILITLR